MPVAALKTSPTTIRITWSADVLQPLGGWIPGVRAHGGLFNQPAVGQVGGSSPNVVTYQWSLTLPGAPLFFDYNVPPGAARDFNHALIPAVNAFPVAV